MSQIEESLINIRLEKFIASGSTSAPEYQQFKDNTIYTNGDKKSFEQNLVSDKDARTMADLATFIIS